MQVKNYEKITNFEKNFYFDIILTEIYFFQGALTGLTAITVSAASGKTGSGPSARNV